MSLTRLDAINTCLRGIGISPVATEDDPDLDAAQAGLVVDQISMNLQSTGWWFNKEYNWKLTPDATTGYISAPGSALSIVTTGESRNVGLTIRGTKIYDLFNHTFDLRERALKDGTIEFVFITELPFADLPPTAKQAVTYISRREFAQDLEVDQVRWKFQMEDEKLARAALIKEDARNKKRNSLTDNAQVALFLANVGGPNAHSASYAIYPKRSSY